MKVLLTGASGFLGQHILRNFIRDHEVITLGRSEYNEIRVNLSEEEWPDLDFFDLVIHAAGKAHVVPRNLIEKNDFIKVNFIGTKNLLKKLETFPPANLVFISTVAVYGENFQVGIKEDEPLLGMSPYAKSKILAEKEVFNWGKKFGVKVFILRLPLVTGLNPPGNLKSLHHAIEKGYHFGIGKGDFRKSIVSADDVSQLLLRIIQFDGGIFNLTDGLHPTIRQIEEKISQVYGKKIKSLPQVLIGAVAFMGEYIPKFPLNKSTFRKLTQDLYFDDSKAKKLLNWQPENGLLKLTFTSSKNESNQKCSS